LDYPILVVAKGVAPAEDSGGIVGWKMICKVLSSRDVKHPDFTDMYEWYFGKKYKSNAKYDMYELDEREIKFIKEVLNCFNGGYKNMSSEKLLKEMKTLGFCLTSSFIKEILNRKDTKELMEKELTNIMKKF